MKTDVQPRPKKMLIRPWPALMTIEVLCDYCGVGRSTVNEWLADGKINPHPLPGIRGRDKLDKVVFDRREIDRFLGIRPE